MNILQIEDDLKGMPTDVIVRHLQNPTGLIPTYLAAGELNRREKMQVARAEAPQETVVDEIIQKAMPMGGMPMPQAPMPQMPMPRPEEVMVSDTITETGIAGLPAPNVGNYKEGGIIGYQDGGDVSFLDRVRDFDYRGLLNDRLSGLEEGLDERIAGNEERMRIYEETGEFPELSDQALDDTFSVSGIGSLGKVGGKAKPYIQNLIKKVQDKFKPTPTKPLTKKQKAKKKKLTKKEQDAFLKKQQTLSQQKALDKANQFKKPSTKGPVTQGIADAAKFIGPKIGPGIQAMGRGIRDNYGELGLAGLGGLGLHMLANEGVLYGDTPEETARIAAEAKFNSPEEVKKRADLAKDIANKTKEQERADALQAKRDDEARRRAYLALALGGAKTMAGQSPFALTNIGEGLGTGIGGLVELDEAAATRQANVNLAEQKYLYDLVKQDQDQINEFNEFKLKLRGGEDAFFTQRLAAKLDDEGIDLSDMSNPRYIEIENETIIELYPSMVPKGSAIVDGQAFTGV